MLLKLQVSINNVIENNNCDLIENCRNNKNIKVY